MNKHNYQSSHIGNTNLFTDYKSKKWSNYLLTRVTQYNIYILYTELLGNIKTDIYRYQFYKIKIIPVKCLDFNKCEVFQSISCWYNFNTVIF